METPPIRPPYPLTDEEIAEEVDDALINGHNGHEASALEDFLYNLKEQQVRELELWRDECIEYYARNSIESPRKDVNADSNSPKAIKLKIATSIGRTIGGLDVFVSDWKRTYKKDLPWVSRVPGLAWIPIWDEFVKWIESYAGQEQKRKRGRPKRNKKCPN